ncbi:MAG: phenylalanine--tRNA ligase subunit beta [Patescibacteria group bacterium]|nr:MAG: phenylalanine--tRNA ligase subunit beta [Patescibacteria group bacterium]
MNLLVSYNWLKQYVKLKQSPQEFAARLSLSGPSVERIHPQGAALEKVVVGKIVKVKPHPNADKLRVVETDLGSMTKDVVCGGSNLNEGQLVAVALPGSWVKWHGEGEPVEIKEAALRGVNSYGMICGADEIGLLDRFPKKEEKEIVDLTALNLKPGTPLAEALGFDDVVFDVEVTSNRPDAFCMVGMALEASAILNAPMVWKEPKAPKMKAGAKALPLAVSVEAKKLCPRYQALVMKNVKVGPSPAWMKERLASAGVRSINNLVDITNYIRLELGQPMHVFDYDKLGGKKIVVREAKAGEKLAALDGNAYDLKAGQLVIADAERPVAVAGVMGGEESGTTERTTTIVFESAAFEPVSVRRTARALNLHSDSSQLYEKGLSTEVTSPALARAAELAAELAGAEIASKVFDVRASVYKPLVVPFRPSRASALIGVDIPAKDMRRTLTALGFKVVGTGERWKVTVPSWRDHDIEGERDLVEEVARVHGYDNLPSVVPEGRLPLAAPDRALVWEDRAKRALKGWGFTELMTYSFVSKDVAEKSSCGEQEMLRVSNPLTEEFEYMRDRLIGSVLKIVAENQEEAVEGRAFELANVYKPRKGDLPLETPRLMIVSWSRHDDGRDVFAIKGAVEALLEAFGVRGAKFARGEGSDVWHPGRSGVINVGDQMLGGFGEFHPQFLKRFGIDRRVAGVSLDFPMLASWANEAKVFSPIPEFPRVKRDLAFVVERHLEHAAIAAALENADALIASVELFDVYEGKSLGQGKKSMAYHLEFGASDRTLKAEEVDRVLETLRTKLTSDFGAEVRS